MSCVCGKRVNKIKLLHIVNSEHNVQIVQINRGTAFFVLDESCFGLDFNK